MQSVPPAVLSQVPLSVLGAVEEPRLSRRTSAQTQLAQAVCSPSVHSCAAEPAQGEDFCLVTQPVTKAVQGKLGMSSGSVTSAFVALKCPWGLQWGEGWHPGLCLGYKALARLGVSSFSATGLTQGHPHVHLRHGLIIWTEKKPSEMRSTRSWGTGSRKISSLTRLPHAFPFYWPQLISPFNVFKATGNKSAAVNKFSTAEKQAISHVLNGTEKPRADITLQVCRVPLVQKASPLPHHLPASRVGEREMLGMLQLLMAIVSKSSQLPFLSPDLMIAGGCIKGRRLITAVKKICK